MRHQILLLCVTLVIGQSVYGRDSQSATLIGRWYGKGPSGYGVTDRYSDGRFATKDYLQYDSSKPPEVIISWGRWKFQGGTYSEIIDGATSQAWLQFPRKSYSHKVTAIAADRFSYISNEGHDTDEYFYASQQPLIEVELRRPKEYRWKKPIDTVTPARGAIPAWVNAHPVRPRS
jgi:hypothetical protein